MKRFNFVFNEKSNTVFQQHAKKKKSRRNVNKTFFLLLALSAYNYSYSQYYDVNVRVTDMTPRFNGYKPMDMNNNNSQPIRLINDNLNTNTNYNTNYKSPADYRREAQEREMRDLEIERMKLENERLRRQNASNSKNNSNSSTTNRATTSQRSSSTANRTSTSQNRTSTTNRTTTSQSNSSASRYMTIKSEIPLRESASVNSRAIYQCPKGARVEVLNNSGEAYYRVHINGHVGYVSKSYLTNP